MMSKNNNENLHIKISTIARIGALLVALSNQVLAIFGKAALPFAENVIYQIISIIATIVVTVINAWYNNDITLFARLAGEVLRALDDGQISEEEIESLLNYAENSQKK